MLTVTNISFSYKNKLVLSNLSFALEKGGAFGHYG